MIRFIHITDTHVRGAAGFELYGRNAFAYLETLVDHLNRHTFPIDFVLHTGDVVDDRSEAAYHLAKTALSKLRYPIYYVAGNHDDPAALRRVLLNNSSENDLGGRFDYSFSLKGITFAVFDSRGERDPAGWLSEEQLAALRTLCTADGPPLVIVLHHPPLPLDSQWIDHGAALALMLVENHAAFRAAIAPARGRLRGVFFGHIHRAYQAYHEGILYASAASALAQLESYPEQPYPNTAPDEPAGYSIVTMTGETTILRHIFLRLPS